jgi:phage-related protein
MHENRKLLFWEGSSKKDFKAFPVSVQKDMGSARPWRKQEIMR